MVIEGGTVNSSSSSNNSYGIYNENIGSVEVNEGTVNSENSSIFDGKYSYGIYNASSGNVTVKGGTVSSSSNNKNTSNTSVSSYGICNGKGNIVIEGGTVSSSSSSSGNGKSNSYGISNANTGSVVMEGGTVSSSSNSSSSGSFITSYGIYNANTGSIKMREGTINASNENTPGNSYGIYNASKGSVVVEGGAVSSSSWTSRSNSYGIYNASSGIVTVKGGTVSSSNIGNSYGIYNKSGGIITIGIKEDGLVSNTEPSITGTKTNMSSSYIEYGVYNTVGTFNFYDGIISGKSLAIYDTLTEYETDTNLLYNDDRTELILSTEEIALARIKNMENEEYIEYTSLQEAINVCEDGQTIEILRGTEYTIDDEALIIEQGKNVIIDLKGKKISSTIPNYVIENNGNLEITDSVGGGMIVTAERTTIYNKESATLTLTGGSIDNRKTQAVYNEGNFVVDGGNINYENVSIYGIYNVGEGFVQVNDGTVKNSSNNGAIYAIYNTDNATVKITGGTVICNSKYSYGIYNTNTGSVVIEGGIVSSSGYYSYGIYNENNGSIEVKGGTISSSSSSENIGKKSYGIYNNSTGSITVGIKGDGLLSNENPTIISTKLTESLTDSVSYGVYNPNGEFKYYDGTIKALTKAIYSSLTEIEDNTGIVVTNEDDSEVITLQEIEENAAIVDDIEYFSVNEAMKILGDASKTIKLIKNTDIVGNVIINETQDITIDLNGYALNNYFTIQNKGRLTIIDSSIGKVGKIVNMYNSVIINKGTLNMNEGTINNASIAIKNEGVLNINNATISNNTYGIYNTSGTVNIDNDAIINDNTYGLYITSGIANIISGEISSNTYGIYNSGGTSNINGGNIEINDYGVYVKSGMVNINSNGITNNGYGAYNSGGTLKVFEGTEINSTNVGIQNASGTVYIGESGTVNKNSPVITGENYGLVNGSSSIVYFYDGQIKGKQSATQGFITYTESGYRVANKQEGEYWIDYLALAGTIQTVATVNGVEYSNLQSAINACSEGETITITLTNGIETDITFTISEGRTIILDMNEKTISSSAETTIINQGNLTIIDSTSSGVGKISNTNSNGTSINNSGTLTLGTDDGTVSQNLITIEGETYGIINSGTLNFYDGVIKGSAALSGTATSKPSGYVISTTTSGGKEMYFLTR